MDHALTFARHFARLVWLLLVDPASTDEQKGALRALVMMAKDGEIAIVVARDGGLVVNGESLPAILSGVAELVARLQAHGLRTIQFERDAPPAHILRVARQLVAAPAPVTSAALPEPETPSAAPAASAPVPKLATPDVGAQPASGASMFPLLDVGEVLEEQIAAALARITPASAAPPIPEAAGRPRSTPGGMFDHFASRESGASSTDLLARLEADSNPTALLQLLDQLAVRAERVIGDDPSAAAEIFRRIVRRERDIHDLEVKRVFVLTVKRLAKPGLLKALVAELAGTPALRESSLAALTRAGEDGADALIEQLAAEGRRAERRVLFDALVELQAGVPTLVHMLGDARWYVARNAATLLGELRARDAEAALAGVLHHDDERVRHAATIALMRLESPRSLPTIEQALGDHAPQIRMHAAAALVGRREGTVTAMLLRAVDTERDDEVLATFIMVLGRLGTSEALARLAAIAAPDRGLFRKKPVALRVAAVRALGEAGSDEALAAIRALRDDKSDNVRANVAQVLRRHPQATESAG